MTPISNAEKQARLRKKELLKWHADKIFRKWESFPKRNAPTRTPQDVRQTLDKAVELPSGWTEEDYVLAARNLGQIQLDLELAVDQIANDVDGDWHSRIPKFQAATDPVKYIADNKSAIEKAQSLASHMISALNLSGCNDAERAAALMEAVRYVGRSLVSNRTVHNSQATAMCLASIGPQYDRPEWFTKKLATTIGWQIGQSRAHELGQHLTNFIPKNPQ